MVNETRVWRNPLVHHGEERESNELVEAVLRRFEIVQGIRSIRSSTPVMIEPASCLRFPFSGS